MDPKHNNDQVKIFIVGYPLSFVVLVTDCVYTNGGYRMGRTAKAKENKHARVKPEAPTQVLKPLHCETKSNAASINTDIIPGTRNGQR